MEPTGSNQWVNGLRAGQPAAFDAAYAHFRPRLFTYLARLCNRRDLAEDFLQDVFLRLARSAPTLAEDTDLAAWLFTVAGNLVRSHQRWRLVDFARLSEVLWASKTETTLTPFDAVEASQAERAVERGLRALSLSDREVLLLVGVEGLSPAQAAAVLGLKPEALRQRLSRARSRLAEQLHEAGALAPVGGVR